MHDVISFYFCYIIYMQTTRQRYSVTTHDTPSRYNIIYRRHYYCLSGHIAPADDTILLEGRPSDVGANGQQADTREDRMWIKKKLR